MKLKRKNILTILAISVILGACKQPQHDIQSNDNEVKNDPVVLSADSTSIPLYVEVSDLPPEAYLNSEIEKIGWELMRTEKFGEIKLGIDSISVVEILGQPDSVTTVNYWGADGGYHNEWVYTTIGITIGFNRIPDHPDSKFHERLTDRITMTAPSIYSTNRRIQIGSPKIEVTSNYRIAIADTIGYNNHLVAGTVYGGLIFQFKQDTVVSIFLGAAAE